MSTPLPLLIHRLLRRVLPRRIRRLRGGEMESTFARQLEASRAGGNRLAAISLWRREVTDLLRTGLQLRLRDRSVTRILRSRSSRKRAMMIDRLHHDLRLAVRGFVTEPGWTFAAVLTLALAIGATTAIFTVVDAVLLEPLPYDESHRLVAVGAWDITNERGSVGGSVSYPTYDALRRAQQPLEDLAAYRRANLTVLIGGAAERMHGAAATASLFAALRVTPAVGRTYTEENDVENGQGAVLLSWRFWRQRFGADPGIVGDTLVIDEDIYEIAGVMPAGFAFPSREVDFWVSMAHQTRSPYNFFLEMLGRMRPDISIEQATDQMRALAVDVPDNPSRATEGYAGLVVPLHEAVVAEIEQQLVIFMAAVSAVLLIACINVVNLMLSRAAGRHKERTIRAALGATRARLMQQLLTESTLLAVAGAVLGLLLATALTDTLVALSPVSLPRQEAIGIDGGVMLFNLALALGVGIAVGLPPALRGSTGGLIAGLQSGTRGASADRQHRRLRGGLIVAQVAVAVVLLFSAGLLLQTLSGLLGLERGYDADEVLTLSTSLPSASYPDYSTRKALYDGVLERIRGLSGVRSASMSMLLPFGGMWQYGLDIEGYTPADDEFPSAETLMVTSGFFDTLGIPLLSGRLLAARDGRNAIVINQTMAGKYWPEGGALGARVTLGNDENPATVVGIVNDTRYTSLEAEETAQVYRPWAEGESFDMMLFVRTAQDPRALTGPIREIFAAADREIAVADIMTIGDRLWNTTAEERFRALLLGTFGATALLLAIVGVYGVMAYNVAQRTRELGIRKALGADDDSILRRVVGGGLALVALGSMIGAAGCWYVATLLEAYLFGIEARDPWTFVAVTLALALAALAASWVPGRRAARVDPLVALRAE
jgi:predicted permease